MPFSPSSSLDCLILQGIRTFGETGSRRIEFKLTLVLGCSGRHRGHMGLRQGWFFPCRGFVILLFFEHQLFIHVLAWFGCLGFTSNLHSTSQSDSIMDFKIFLQIFNS
ncbi:hypothetical protein ACFX2B_022544 [Malus domestica]